ncbi:phosphatidylcholine:diacylglycerol cholinephosphotransferase 1-like isoform X2 [Glycine soja]|uniref:phosphatidylcholine:diacylglycerol cholinephosphotransferase 1-like isoform X2 n=1 Tax=Glycine soja TaxID=3848 RepID=UPI00103D005D|nr:phosphatidylcholine:diacylglycerol cholinephosphotransferase 1-like isoform X2 [Glycine soja]
MDRGGCCPRGDASLDAVLIRIRASLLHGRGIHAPHGSAVVAAFRSGLHCHALPPRTPRVIAESQHALRRAQYRTSFTLSPDLNESGHFFFLVSDFVVGNWEIEFVWRKCKWVFVGMQTSYILWTWLIEGRPRATISALFMFTCRGILGYSTQLPLPQGFLGSGVDFPVGNVSFFLFFSGHVAGSVIASLDMRRMQRWELAWTFDVLNVLQAVRLLGTRGHYTIDLAVGVGAGILFDSLAGKYEDSKRNAALSTTHRAQFDCVNNVDIAKKINK